MSAVSSNRGFPDIAKYELAEEIGHGGMATVYRARDARLERDVAVKVIHKHLRDNAEVRRRFVAEAKAVAKLRHPGIVEVYDVSDDEDEERYLVVELIRGTTLRKVLQDHGHLPAEIAAIIVATLCDAVEHAHQSGVVHRDIKPENVLIETPRARSSGHGPPADAANEDQEADTDQDPPRASDRKSGKSSRPGSGRSSDNARVLVKLTDFGIAKVLDVQGVTSTGQILGSPAHMAPEQIEGGNVGPHTDVFALGVLLYECMVGHLPFEGKNPAQVLRRVLDGDYEQADSERAEVGGRWSRVCAQALDRDIEARLGTAAELGRMIHDELAQLGIDDGRAELCAYFEDPQAYWSSIGDRLVPRLLERGEKERRRGLVHGAAADFNRALALRPDDLGILRRASSLGAQALWKRRIARGALILASSALLGGAAFGLTRLVRPSETRVRAEPVLARVLPFPMVAPVTSVPVASASGTASAPDASAPQPSASARPSADPFDTPPPVGSLPPPASGRRKVRFALTPSGQLELNGAPTEWFGEKELAPGTYSVHVRPPAAAPKCCEELSTSVVVTAPPADDPDQVQPIPIALKVLPARVFLMGAPADGAMTCAGAGLTVGAGGSAQASLKDILWRGSCTFSPSGKTQSVTLRAGETTSVSWPP